VLCGITPLPPHREINKTALGATDSMEWRHEESVVETVQKLKGEGYITLALEQTENSLKLQDFTLKNIKRPVALILGNEVFGVNQEVIEECDLTIEIPQEGTKHSLNVSVSAGMIMWEIFKELRF
jgi:tRNA G18 (ribose-2'-O)-methylase SpoU